MGVAPDSRIEIPDEHTMQILQTRDNYVQVSDKASPSWLLMATRRVVLHRQAIAGSPLRRTLSLCECTIMYPCSQTVRASRVICCAGTR